MNRKQFLNGSLWIAAAAVLGIPLTEKVIERFPEIQESEHEYTDVFIAPPGTVMQFHYVSDIEIGDKVYVHDNDIVDKVGPGFASGLVVSIPNMNKVNILLLSMYTKVV